VGGSLWSSKQVKKGGARGGGGGVRATSAARQAAAGARWWRRSLRGATAGRRQFCARMRARTRGEMRKGGWAARCRRGRDAATADCEAYGRCGLPGREARSKLHGACPRSSRGSCTRFTRIWRRNGGVRGAGPVAPAPGRACLLTACSLAPLSLPPASWPGARVPIPCRSVSACPCSRLGGQYRRLRTVAVSWRRYVPARGLVCRRRCAAAISSWALGLAQPWPVT
jgi:hypothetical protein